MFLDTAASLTLLGRDAICKRAAVQEPNVPLGTPSKDNIVTTKTLELLLAKLPIAARRAFRVPDIPHNLMAGAELVDAGCGLHLYKTYAEIDYEGETLYRGWRDKPTRLWRFDLTSKGGRITPTTDPFKYDPSNGMVLSAIKQQELHHIINSIYECKNKEQLIKYMHASLGSHPKTALIAAVIAGYFKGCPDMTVASISKCIAVKYATELGHIKQIQQGVWSASRKSNRGRPSQRAPTASPRTLAIVDTLATREQSPGNQKTHHIYMTVKKTEGCISSNHVFCDVQQGNEICLHLLHLRP